MSFNKRYLSEESIRIQSKNGDVDSFSKYFSADVMLYSDVFSKNVLKTMNKCFRIKDKDERTMNIKSLMDSINHRDPSNVLQ